MVMPAPTIEDLENEYKRLVQPLHRGGDPVIGEIKKNLGKLFAQPCGAKGQEYTIKVKIKRNP